MALQLFGGTMASIFYSYQCAQDYKHSKALRWARISPAIERLAIEGVAPAPLFISSKSNLRLVLCFTGKTLHRELTALIRRGAEAKLTEFKLFPRSEII
jgi:hypothetical protein